MVKKIVIWGGVAFLIFSIVIRPESSGAVIKSIGTGIADVLAGLGRFFTSIIS